MSAKAKQKSKGRPIGSANKPGHKAGRPVELTVEERETNALERNRTYQTSAAYKAHRKNRYATDPAYRAACLANAKSQAEKRTAAEAENYADSVKSNIARAGSIGSIRLTEEAEHLTFSIPELAELIERPAAVIRGWVNSGRFPQPPLTSLSVGVYSRRQAISLAEAVVKHLRIPTAHLTASRTDAIIALAEAMRP